MILNFKAIEFHDFFDRDIQTDILNALSQYQLIENNVIRFRKPEAKRIISYYIIYHIMKAINECKANKTVFVVQPHILNDDIMFFKYVSSEAMGDSVCKYIQKTLKMLSKAYPDRVMLFDRIVDLSSNDMQQIIFNRCNTFSGGTKKLLNLFSNENFNKTRISNT